MAQRLAGRRIAFLATHGVEQIELTAPLQAVKESGAEVHLVSLEPGEIQGFNHYDKGDTFKVDCVVSQVNAADYDGLVLPGGVANPDTLRGDPAAVRFVKDFVENDKPVAAICHGPWLLVEADAVKGRTLTSWPTLKTDIRNAGGDWVDRNVVVDQKLVTSRKPDDLPAFCSKIVDLFANAISNRGVDQTVEGSFPASDPPSWAATTATGSSASGLQPPG